MEPERLVERQLVAEVRRLGHRRHGDVRRLSRGGAMILPETVAVSSITSFMVPRSSRSMIVGPY
jgi:hypothetical protein